MVRLKPSSNLSSKCSILINTIASISACIRNSDANELSRQQKLNYATMANTEQTVFLNACTLIFPLMINVDQA